MWRIEMARWAGGAEKEKGKRKKAKVRKNRCLGFAFLLLPFALVGAGYTPDLRVPTARPLEPGESMRRRGGSSCWKIETATGGMSGPRCLPIACCWPTA